MLASSKCLFLSRGSTPNNYQFAWKPLFIAPFFVPLCLIDCSAFTCWLSVFIFHDFDWDSFPFPNPLLGGWFVSRRLLLSRLHFYFVAPKSRSSFVANFRYIVYDCYSSIGQRCAGNAYAISNIGHHSAIVLLLALYRRSFCHSILYLYSIVLLWFHRHNRVGTLFFATAEFIFDDWHRFLGVLIGQPCWSAHGPLSAHFPFGRNTTPMSVILYATLLDTTNFLLSIETTRSHIPLLHLWTF